MRGRGAAAQPALLRVDGAGRLTLIDTAALQFSAVDLPNLSPTAPRARTERTEAITHLAYAGGRLWVSGLSNEEFSSKLWSVPYPFTKADGGASLQIYHGNHHRLETRAPMYAFVPYTIDGQPYVIGAYLCTPLVKFPLSALQPAPGRIARGTTIGELGAGSRPIDMILYRKDGHDYILMANTTLGVVKIATAGFGAATPIDAARPVTGDTGGVPFETIDTDARVRQLDLLDAAHSIELSGNDSAALDLKAVELP
jgi:hypothetical protein